MFFCKVSIQIKKCCRICSSPEKSGNIFNYISVMIMIYFSPLRCFSRSAQKASTTSANANRNIIAEPATFVSSAVFTPSVFCEPDAFPAVFVPLDFLHSCILAISFHLFLRKKIMRENCFCICFTDSLYILQKCVISAKQGCSNFFCCQ